MSQESIYNTLYAALTLTDSIFQIWITLTFAVLVATYVAERRFDRSMYRLVSSLYGLASGILLIRFASAAFVAFHYKNLLLTRGFEPWPVPNVVSLIIGFGTTVLLFCGHSSPPFGLCEAHGRRESLARSSQRPNQAMGPTASRRELNTACTATDRTSDFT